MNKGDKVRVINYGHVLWECKPIDPEFNLSSYPIISENDTTIFRDIMPEMVGREGIINEKNISQGRAQYSLREIEGKSAWYSEDQLELV